MGTSGDPGRAPRGSRVGYALVAVCSLFAALNGVLARVVIDADVPARQIAAMRVYGAALILLVAVVPSVRRIRRAHLAPLVGFGLIGLCLGPGAYFEAISRADIAIVLVIVFTAPLVVALVDRVARGIRLPRHAYGAIAVAIGGLVLSILGGGDSMEGLSTAGVAFAIAGMAAYVISVFFVERLPVTLPPLARTGSALLVASLGWLVLAPPWTFPYDRLDEEATFAGPAGFSLPIWVAVLLIVVVGSVLVYVTWISGTIRIGAGAASVVGMAEPVIGAILAWVLLGQSLAALQILGIAVTVGAIVVVERARITVRATDAPVSL